jgi:hypothetical protein
MFPDFRLMIAAVLGSVVALMCGFGVFAAFRVNHEPLARLPSATAPLQLVVGNAAPLPLAIAAAPPTALTMIDAPIRNDDAGGTAAPPAPAVVPEPQTAAAEPEPAAPQAPEPRTAEAEPTALESVEPPAAPTVQATDERAAEAPAPESDPAPTASASPPKPLSPQDQPQQASLPDEEHAAERTDGLATFAEMNAVADAAAAQALPVEKAKQESEASHAGAGGEPRSATAHKPARQVEEKKRTRVAARTRRARRPRSNTVADLDAQTGAASQFATTASPQFQTAPQALDGPAAQTNGARRVKLTSRKPARKRSAVGGPFVRPPQR